VKWSQTLWVKTVVWSVPVCATVCYKDDTDWIKRRTAVDVGGQQRTHLFQYFSDG